MVLLDEGANPCECHVIDDTPRFLTIVILNTRICDCSVADPFLTSSLSLSTHLDSVRMVLLDEGASPCECHVIGDTPCFLTIVILPPSTVNVQLQIHF